ncbi:MAG TPA: DNA-binding protein WhiA [Bacillota bacterium]|nr:DNA-binding protein WhiA [Bacillota bacterium]HPF42866.1 DNA-binding protein WhiA [Bacillota bacterium]HPJ86100.1 DNA-binding protein WhiA [Bacillota bacterium]HPQ61497.1 DNA-binding protein WhiA [Bacillota bacterium]HRX92064.1 DNA-binding protein WhiA [Candidatus Izemoplasmatales bacterium]
MSFSTDVKTELSSLKHLDCCNKAELSALFHVGGTVERSNNGMAIEFQSTNLAVVRRVIGLVTQLYNDNYTLMSKKQTKLQKKDMYIVRLEPPADDILSDLAIIDKSGMISHATDKELIKKECCKKAYLRGAFLAGGSINNPDTAAYHLEIQTFAEKAAEQIGHLANEFDLNAKIAKNRRGNIVYMKEAEKIADFLRVVDATNSLFTFEDNRIKRDFKNSINRVINCDIANEKKAIEAANKQLEYIEVIEQNHRNDLPESIEQAIFLRKKYPESTLLELSYAAEEHYGNRISKSALNHRFRAIKDLALQIRIEEEGK